MIEEIRARAEALIKHNEVCMSCPNDECTPYCSEHSERLGEDYEDFDIKSINEVVSGLLAEVERLKGEIAFYKAVDNEHTYAGLTARAEWYRCNMEHISQLTDRAEKAEAELAQAVECIGRIDKELHVPVWTSATEESCKELIRQYRGLRKE